MAKKKEELDGVWRTVGGRRIFIKNGQDLSSAMKESGKFKNMRKDIQDNVKFKDMKEDTIKRKGVTSEEYQRAEDNVAQLKKERNALEIEVGEYDDDDMMRGSPAHDEVRWALQNKEDELREAQKKYDGLMKKDGHLERKYKMPTNNDEYELYKRAKENPDSIDPMTENSTDWEALDKKYSSRYEKVSGKKYAKDVKSMTMDEYIEKNNAKYESPNGTHFAGEELYSDDPNRFGDKLRKYNNKMNPSKNDALNKVKNNRIVENVKSGDRFYEIGNGQWRSEKDGYDYYIDFNSSNIDNPKYKDVASGRIINTNPRADNYWDYEGDGLKTKYKGTIDYLQKTTDMNGAEILELLRQIDKDKK